MSAGWEVGDLALCIESGTDTRSGAIYAVSDVKQPGEIRDGSINRFPHQLLRFTAIYYCKAHMWSGSPRFVKVTPPAADKFDRETIELMNRKPAKLTPVSSDGPLNEWLGEME